ncbi:hypothetical protein EJ110_NYTH54398 [Nymphaea thermarum]|nr:hypothetical protein EJ110_NYTH54398 [Nymphaea thermarum]
MGAAAARLLFSVVWFAVLLGTLLLVQKNFGRPSVTFSITACPGEDDLLLGLSYIVISSVGKRHFMLSIRDW